MLSLLQFLRFKKTSLIRVILSLFLCSLVVIGTLVGQQESTLRYIYTIFLMLTFSTYFKNNDEDRCHKDIIRLTYLIFALVLLEQFLLRDTIHNFYRAGNTALHANRESGSFLYPGDLGATFAIILTYWIYRISKIEHRISIKEVLFGMLLVFLVLASQSRMAVLHVLIALMFFLNFKSLAYIILFILLTTIIYWYELLHVDYFLKSLTTIYDYGWLLFSENTPLKRIQELYSMVNSMLGVYVAPDSFYESGVVSLYFKTGLFGILVYLIVMSYVVLKAARTDMRLLGIVIPILLTGLISAPIDRPKLVVVATWALAYSITRKSKYRLAKGLIQERLKI